MRSAKRILLMGAACSAFFTQGAFAQATPVGPDEIRSAWVGKKLLVRSPSGALMDFSMKSDGTADVVGPNFADTGKWRLSEDGYCTTWTRLRGGREACFTVVRNGARMEVLNTDKSPGGDVLKISD